MTTDERDPMKKNPKLKLGRETLAHLNEVHGGQWGSVTASDGCTYYKLTCRTDEVTRTCRACTVA